MSGSDIHPGFIAYIRRLARDPVFSALNALQEEVRDIWFDDTKRRRGRSPSEEYEQGIFGLSLREQYFAQYEEATP